MAVAGVAPEEIVAGLVVEGRRRLRRPELHGGIDADRAPLRASAEARSFTHADLDVELGAERLVDWRQGSRR